VLVIKFIVELIRRGHRSVHRSIGQHQLVRGQR
jgi:hypothetical protein